MEINTRLQNQLDQEKNDMQMKSEELNILIRSRISAPASNTEDMVQNSKINISSFCQVF